MTVDNSTLFLVQGTGQALNLPGCAWGNGFVTDKPTVTASTTPCCRPHLRQCVHAAAGSSNSAAHDAGRAFRFACFTARVHRSWKRQLVGIADDGGVGFRS